MDIILFYLFTLVEDRQTSDTAWKVNKIITIIIIVFIAIRNEKTASVQF